MFAKVSDKFHHRKQNSGTTKNGQSQTTSGPVNHQPAVNAYFAKPAPPQQQGQVQQSGNGGMDGWSGGTPMEGVER